MLDLHITEDFSLHLTHALSGKKKVTTKPYYQLSVNTNVKTGLCWTVVQVAVQNIQNDWVLILLKSYCRQ